MEQSPAGAPTKKRTGLYIAVVAILILVLVAAAFGVSRVVASQQAAATATAQYVHDYGACGVAVVASAADALGSIRRQFSDVFEVANATGRGSLAPVIRDMQDIGQAAQGVEVPVCLAGAKSDLVAGVDASVDGFLAFMSEFSDTTINGHFDDAVTSFQQFSDNIERVQACAPDC